MHSGIKKAENTSGKSLWNGNSDLGVRKNGATLERESISDLEERKNRVTLERESIATLGCGRMEQPWSAKT